METLVLVILADRRAVLLAPVLGQGKLRDLRGTALAVDPDLTGQARILLVDNNVRVSFGDLADVQPAQSASSHDLDVNRWHGAWRSMRRGLAVKTTEVHSRCES